MRPEDFSDDDLMLNLESQILNALTKHGGQVIVAGPEMDSLIKDFIEDVLTHPDRRRWAAEHLRRLQLIDGPVTSKAPAQRGQQVPGGNRDTVRVRGGRGASGEQLPGGNLAGQADHSDGRDDG